MRLQSDFCIKFYHFDVRGCVDWGITFVSSSNNNFKGEFNNWVWAVFSVNIDPWAAELLYYGSFSLRVLLVSIDNQSDWVVRVITCDKNFSIFLDLSDRMDSFVRIILRISEKRGNILLWTVRVLSQNMNHVLMHITCNASVLLNIVVVIDMVNISRGLFIA